MSQPGAAIVDLRSDTVTLPGPGMREAMAGARVGDDSLGEDPTVRLLEERVAELLGKERALFFPSGVMANQAGILALGSPGTEVIAEARAHLIHWEEASVAAHGGMMLRGIPAADGILTADELRRGLKPSSLYFPRASVLALENTHLDSGGRVMSAERTNSLAAIGRDAGMRIHLDGARLWNAAVAAGSEPSALTASADTVMTCLSKGLGAPAGSMLAGTAEVIEGAWRIRRRLGGQMRQVGILAAAGLYALDHHLERMSDDHRRAAALAERFGALPGIHVIPPETSIVMVDVSASGIDAGSLLERMARVGVRMSLFGQGRIRAVVHLDVDDAGVARAAAALADAVEEGG